MEQIKLPKESILAMVENNPKIHQLLDSIKDWDNVTLNPINSEICVKLTSNYGIKIISFVLPTKIHLKSRF